MATGSTLYLLSYTDKPISEDLYKIYLEKIKEFNQEGLLPKKNDTIEYPLCFFMRDPNLTVLNLNRTSDIGSIHVTRKYSTDFNSGHTILTEFWSMDPYDIVRSEHLITDTEVSQILQVCRYIDSNLIYHKDAARIEDVLLSSNPFFEPFIKELPSREFPKEFAKGDPELKETEDCTRFFCKEFETFLRFYKSVSSNSWYTKENYVLIYTKW